MSREIKFRAWVQEGAWEEDGSQQKYTMLYGDELAFEEYEPINDLLAGVENLMQFTGLKDKNGKEIYENDLVRFVDGFAYDGNEGIVKFGDYDNGGSYEDFEGGNGWYIEITKGWLSKGTPKTLYSTKYEILGNIYENPELRRWKKQLRLLINIWLPVIM